MGVCIAVDDFGAGYSSLGLLMSLDVDALKIDRSLLDFDTTCRGSLVMAIAELGHTLGLKVVAEGVETPQHLHRAREACCDAVQGSSCRGRWRRGRWRSSCGRGRRRGWGAGDADVRVPVGRDSARMISARGGGLIVYGGLFRARRRRYGPDDQLPESDAGQPSAR